MKLPSIILVEPQLGQNIGMVARAMKNFALLDLRLVAPRDGWPNPEALAAASGADDLIREARFFPTVAAAIADLQLVYATSARPRDMRKPVLSLREAAQDFKAHQTQSGARAGILFGRERWGLTNEEVSLANALVVYPTNPQFASLNLSQAVLLFGYALFTTLQSDEKAERKGVSQRDMGPSPEKIADRPADRAELLAFFARLDEQLLALNYYHPPERTELLRTNWQNLFISMDMKESEVKILHGLLSTLVREKPWGAGSR